jgi:hypothetical protein
MLIRFESTLEMRTDISPVLHMLLLIVTLQPSADNLSTQNFRQAGTQAGRRVPRSLLETP